MSDAKEALQAAEEAQNDEFERQNRLYQEANQKVQEYYEETGLVTDANMWLGETTGDLNWKLEQNAQAVDNAQREVEKYQKAIEEDNEALSAAKSEMETAERAVRNLTGALDDGAGAAGNAARGQEELGSVLSSANEKIEAITKAYQEAFEAARSSVEGQYSLWSDVDQIVETAAGTINNNLTKQIEHWQSYNDSLAKLRERSDDIEGLADVIGSFADGSAESVNAVVGMAAANDEDLKKMVENWQELKKTQQDAEESIAEYRSALGEQMDALQSDLEDDIAAMDLGDEAKESGRTTIQGFMDGAIGMLPAIQQAYSQIGSAALRALYGGRMSGQRATRIDAGGMVDQAYTEGTTSAEAGLALVGEEGPELVMMRGGETVLNARTTQAVLGAGMEINSPLVEINIEGNAGQEVVDQLNRYSEELAARAIAIMQEFETDKRRIAYA